MSPYIVVLIFFAVCLAHGIYRALYDIREDAKQEALQAYYDALREQRRDVIPKVTGLSEAFMGLAKSAKFANKSIKRFAIILDSPGGMSRDWIELHGN